MCGGCVVYVCVCIKGGCVWCVYIDNVDETYTMYACWNRTGSVALHTPCIHTSSTPYRATWPHDDGWPSTAICIEIVPPCEDCREVA